MHPPRLLSARLWQRPCGMKYETVCREMPKHSNRSESETCRRKVQRVQPEPNIKCNQWKRHIISGSWTVLIHDLNTWGFPWNKEIKTHTLTLHLFCSLHLFLTLYSLLWSALESILSFFYKLFPPVLYILSYQHFRPVSQEICRLRKIKFNLSQGIDSRGKIINLRPQISISWPWNSI